MNLFSSLAGGLAGALAVTVLHQILKKYDSDAPRMDLLAMEAISKGLKMADQPIPKKKDLYKYSMAGDIFSNTLYFGLASSGKANKAISKGVFAGLSAGIGAILAPKPLGLNEKYSNKTAKTQFMSVAYYLIGGAVTGVVSKLVDKQFAARGLNGTIKHF
jgi:hypothetical protein